MFTHHDPSFPEMDLPSQGLPFLEHDKVRGKLALCLSGGGFRAALFHLGASVG